MHTRLRLFTIALVVLLPFVAAMRGRAPAQITGTVFEDRNGNGSRDAGEGGLAGVVVSNQIACTATDAAGRFALEGEGHGVAFVSLPSDMTAGRWWGQARAGETIDFALQRAAAPSGRAFTFVHASDTHVSAATVERTLAMKALVADLKPAFVLVTGDLIQDALRVGEAEARAQFELYRSTMAAFPAPVWNAPGNHDIFGIERHRSGVEADHPLYGKRMFRHYLGPNHYSFNHGGVHFVALDTVDVADRWYHGHVDAAQLEWLSCDVRLLAPGTPIVTFNHIPLYTSAMSIAGYQEAEGAGHTLIEVDGRRQFRHSVSNTSDVMRRIPAARWALALGGHIHTRESLRLETGAGPLRFHQAASVIPNPSSEIDTPSGITLYTVTGSAIDEGRFIRLPPGPGRP
jgi:hypothetical protein